MVRKKLCLIYLLLTECLEYFISVLINIHLIKNFRDLSILVDQKSLPGDAHVLFSIHALLTPNAVSLNHFVVGVGNQIELESVFGTKLLVCFLVVDGNAKELDILLLEFVVRITERTCFFRSARCVVFRIKEKYDTLAFEIGELYRIAVLVLRIEIRCLIAFFEHKPPGNVIFRLEIVTRSK
jgi:hypothetical protein